MEFETKDSGERLVFDSGMQRDTEKGKPRYTLVPSWFVDTLVDAYDENADYFMSDISLISFVSDLEYSDSKEVIENLLNNILVFHTQKHPTSFVEIFNYFGELLTRGADKYNDNNWMLAQGESEFKRFHNSLFRHLVQYLMGEDDEDHFSAVLFNIMGMLYVLKRKNETV
jgi:hypothetical protein